MKYVSEEERRKFFLEIMNDIKKKELELRGMKNRISENEFYKKIEILKDAKLRARRAFINGAVQQKLMLIDFKKRRGIKPLLFYFYIFFSK